MAIRRRKKVREFTQIDNAAILNKAMSLKAKGLLAVMMSRPEDWDFYMDWLELQSRDGKEAHQSAMKELEDLGYVVREKSRGGRGRITWDYIVDDEIHGKPAATIEGKTRHGKISTTTGFTTDGRTTDGKPATSNTDLKNTDLTNMEKREKAPAAPALEPSPEEIPAATQDPEPQPTTPLQEPEQGAPKANESSSQTEAPEKVPGGGAAVGATEKYLRRTLSHAFVDRVLEEIQPLGVNRRRDWFALSIERVQELAKEAQATHTEHKVKAPTRLRDLLDQEAQRKGLPALPATQAPEDKYSAAAWEN